MKEVKLGKYIHFKGGECEVLGVARHSETLEEMVVYKHMSGKEEGLWVRPINMFLEEVEINGQKVPRFKYLDES